MSKIYAKKTLGRSGKAKKTVAREFPKTAWDLMGKNKGDWEIISESEFNKINPPKKKTNAEPANLEKVETPKELDGDDGDDGDADKKSDNGEKKEAPKANGISDITIPDVIVELKKLNTAEEVDAYVGDDERKGVKNAASARKEEIAEGAEK